MMDAQVNGSHARTYIDRANDHHHAIVRLQEENARLRAALIECAVQSGADVSGGVPTAPALEEWAVAEVAQLRADYEDALAELPA